MNTIHAALGTWRSTVDAYIVMSEFARDILARAGLPRERLHVKANFTAEPPPAAGENRSGALFVGRLTAEKGVKLLLEAWRDLPIPLKIIGDGPLLATLPRQQPCIEILGERSSAAVTSAMQSAALLVMPSLLYETFGLVVIEAYAAGLPVLASRLGAVQELVQEGRTGLLFEPGDAAGLAAGVRAAFGDPAALARMGENARTLYRERYTPERSHARLLAIYQAAIANRSAAAAVHKARYGAA